MNNLEFAGILDGLGISIRPTIRENQDKIINAGEPGSIKIKNFKCDFTDRTANSQLTALQRLIILAIDMDLYKNSLDYELTPENYEKFTQIIQDKIIKRASEIETLSRIYFQLQHEIATNLGY